MAYTYSKIATYTVGSGGISSMAFLNIPQTYTDLVVKFSVRFTDGGTSNSGLFRINGSTVNYTRILVEGAGSGTPSSYGGGGASAWSTTDMGAAGSTANTFGSGELYIPNYTSSKYKSATQDVVMENNSSTAYSTLNAFLWSDTSAIFYITCTGNFAQHSTFHLYGIKAEL